jgi:hypothetical protein
MDTKACIAILLEEGYTIWVRVSNTMWAHALYQPCLSHKLRPVSHAVKTRRMDSTTVATAHTPAVHPVLHTRTVSPAIVSCLFSLWLWTLRLSIKRTNEIKKLGNLIISHGSEISIRNLGNLDTKLTHTLNYTIAIVNPQLHIVLITELIVEDLMFNVTIIALVSCTAHE